MNTPNGQTNTVEKILSQYEPVTESGCWIWGGYIQPSGYGLSALRGKNVSPHRLFYEHFVGPIPPKYQIDHLCRVRCCVNPAHLEATTSVVNTMRGEGITKKNTLKTHCPYGHQYDVQKLRTSTGKMKRKCSVCMREQNKISNYLQNIKQIIARKFLRELMKLDQEATCQK